MKPQALGIRALRCLRPGDLIQVSGERWVRVLQVPWGFPWLGRAVVTEAGWPVHRDHITAIEKARP